ncbi:hypothetical protein MHUMG1_08477 [Metarhizium humberi]|uniref:Uncharacterized protein n=1 Tax=Metarhizium humberi TaxID=2596975 RepID=A0A9P8M3H2_9HYPO|nr:hypothetical protein MHUMG1_08477 [Metarhizium humberi]
MYVRRLVLAEEGWHDAAGGKGIQYVPSRIRRAGREVSGAAAGTYIRQRTKPRLRHQHASDASSALAQVAHAKGDGMVDAVTAKCAGETRQPAQHDSFTTCIGIHDCTEQYSKYTCGRSSRREASQVVVQSPAAKAQLQQDVRFTTRSSSP